MKTNRLILFALSVLLATAVMGCGTFTVQPTSTPTNTATPTNVPFTPGDYVGTNPDIEIKIDAFGNIEIKMDVPYSNSGIPSHCGFWSVTDMVIRGTVINPDGSFIYGDKSSYGTEVSGKIEGSVIHGQYYLSCNSSVPPLIGSLTATYVVPRPTPTIVPTAIPAKSGHYQGPNVHFNISGQEVTGFELLIYCNGVLSADIRQNGQWFIDDKYGHLNAQGQGNDYLRAEFNGDHASGRYVSLTTCSADWTATWVSP